MPNSELIYAPARICTVVLAAALVGLAGRRSAGSGAR